MDRDASEVPELTDAPVSQSAHGLAVKVLHAQDVDLRGFEDDEVVPPAEVHVDVVAGAHPSSEVLFNGVIDVPSGVLTLGDADREDALEIGPGRWAVQVDCSPHEHAEKGPRVATATVGPDLAITAGARFHGPRHGRAHEVGATAL